MSKFLDLIADHPWLDTAGPSKTRSFRSDWKKKILSSFVDDDVTRSPGAYAGSVGEGFDLQELANSEADDVGDGSATSSNIDHGSASSGDPPSIVPSDDIAKFEIGGFYLVHPRVQNGVDGPSHFPLFKDEAGQFAFTQEDLLGIQRRTQRSASSGAGKTKNSRGPQGPESATLGEDEIDKDGTSEDALPPPTKFNAQGLVVKFVGQHFIFQGQPGCREPQLEGEDGCYVAEVEPFARLEWGHDHEGRENIPEDLLGRRASSVELPKLYDAIDQQEKVADVCDPSHQHLADQPCLKLLQFGKRPKGAENSQVPRGFLQMRVKVPPASTVSPQHASHNAAAEGPTDEDTASSTKNWKTTIVLDAGRRFKIDEPHVRLKDKLLRSSMGEESADPQERLALEREAAQAQTAALGARLKAELSEMESKKSSASPTAEKAAAGAQDKAEKPNPNIIAAQKAAEKAERAKESLDEFNSRFDDNANMALSTSMNGEGPPMMVLFPMGEPIRGRFPKAEEMTARFGGSLEGHGASAARQAFF
ncbi:unnamed protein product [Amoebophrya sp. A25]|nr:unnamed protein product [Amoebophrya sp. A25]|eukprot:GSA25T00011483001.1